MSLTGVWMNELHSVMLLVEHEDQSLTGKYRSAVGRDTAVRDLSGRMSKAEIVNTLITIPTATSSPPFSDTKTGKVGINI